MENTKTPAFDELVDSTYNLLNEEKEARNAPASIFDFLAPLSEKNVDIVKKHILNHWESLTRERPDLFFVQKIKTMDLKQDRDKNVYQKTITEKIIPKDFVTNLHNDSQHIAIVIERSSEYSKLERFGFCDSDPIKE